MRNFGFVLLVAGAAAFLYCSSGLQGLEPLPPGSDLADYYRNTAGRLELGRYAGAGAAFIGLLMALFPQGR